MYVSILTTVYEKGEIFDAFLKHLVRQLVNSSELIVIDDGSTFNHYDYIKKYQHYLNDSVKIIYEKIDHFGFTGIGKAFNYALSKAKGEKIVMLSSDILLLPDALLFLINTLKDPLQIVVGNVIGSDLKYRDKLLKCNSFELFNFFNQIKNERFSPYGFDESYIMLPLPFCLCCYKDLLLDLNGFDESYEVNSFDDTEFAVRMLANITKLTKHYLAKGIHVYHADFPTYKTGGLQNLDKFNNLCKKYGCNKEYDAKHISDSARYIFNTIFKGEIEYLYKGHK